MEPAKVSRAGGWLVRILFSLGVAALSILLLRAIAVQIAPEPDYRNFQYPVVDTKERCEAEGGVWRESDEPMKGPRPARVEPASPETGPRPYCQGPLRIEREQQAQRDHADRVGFFVHLIGGAVALVGALPLLLVTPIAPGFLLAGVVSIMISIGKLWEFAGSTARLVTILVLLVLVAAAGGYFFRDKQSEGQ